MICTGTSTVTVFSTSTFFSTITSTGTSIVFTTSRITSTGTSTWHAWARQGKDRVKCVRVVKVSCLALST